MLRAYGVSGFLEELKFRASYRLFFCSRYGPHAPIRRGPCLFLNVFWRGPLPSIPQSFLKTPAASRTPIDRHFQVISERNTIAAEEEELP